MVVLHGVAIVAVGCIGDGVRLDKCGVDRSSFAEAILPHLSREREASRLSDRSERHGVLLDQEQGVGQRGSVNLDDKLAFLLQVWSLIALGLGVLLLELALA